MRTLLKPAPIASRDGCENHGLQTFTLVEGWSNILLATDPSLQIPVGPLDTELTTFDNLLRSGDPRSFAFRPDCENSNQYSSSNSAETQSSKMSRQTITSETTQATLENSAVGRVARHRRHTLPSFEGTSAGTTREKNRIAASRCRNKKKLEERDLEEMRRSLQVHNAILQETATGLRGEVLLLKNEILKHGMCDFPPIRNYISAAASQIMDIPRTANGALFHSTRDN